MVGGGWYGEVGGSGVMELLGVASVVRTFVLSPPPTPPNFKSVVPKFLLSTGVVSFSLKTPTEKIYAYNDLITKTKQFYELVYSLKIV